MTTWRIARTCVVAITLSLILTNCGFTPQGTLVRDRAQALGQQAMDEGVTNAEWFLCQAASVGSIRRRYGSSADLSDAYRNLCLTEQAVPLIESAPDGSPE